MEEKGSGTVTCHRVMRHWRSVDQRVFTDMLTLLHNALQSTGKLDNIN
jgi:hypothetical protein